MKTKRKLRVGLVVPHLFIHRDILPGVIFSPGTLAIDLCEELQRQGAEVTLFAPGSVATTVPVTVADLSSFESELAGRGYGYIELLKKHPLTFISLARQVQAEIIAKAYQAANDDNLDIVHIYTNEEDLALPFARFCRKPVVFTHHDPFSFLIKYKHVFPKYKHLNWISLSDAQRSGMPLDTNWVGTIYHGLKPDELRPLKQPSRDYIAYLGRIIEPKGVHLAIEAMKHYNKQAIKPLTLKIAGKHYAGHAKDAYWKTRIEPKLGQYVEYVGHIKTAADKMTFLGNARALVVPSLFEEPFGMVSIEALACNTPVIGLDSGATSEIIRNGITGFIVKKGPEAITIARIAAALKRLTELPANACRPEFEARFTLGRMASEHLAVYNALQNS